MVAVQDVHYASELRGWLLACRRRAAQMARGPLENRPCPVCRSSLIEPFVNNGALIYGRCQECTHVFMNPWNGDQPVDYSGEDPLMNQYFEIVQRHREGRKPSGGQAACMDRRISFLRRFVPDSASLLDVGCSTGDFLDLAQLFFTVQGVEPNPKTWAISSRKYPVHLGYVDDLPAGAAFDVLTLNQILYSIEQPPAFFRQMAKRLKPGGMIYVNTPNADSWSVRLFGGRANHFDGFTAVNVFTPGSLRRLAADSGLAEVALETEWLDIYLPDLFQWLEDPSNFVHKRNLDRPDYLADCQRQDDFFQDWNEPGFLGERGNYLVAMFKKP
jgi:SAM-dependent methyltransferase